MLIQELLTLNEASDSKVAKELKAKIIAGFKKLDYKTKQQTDTAGVVRFWMAPKKEAKYDFADKESVLAFIKELNQAMPDLKFELDTSWKGAEGNERRGWNINSKSMTDYTLTTQSNDVVGQVVVSIPKDNKAGEKWRDGYDT